jgi:hypothetical protein
MRTSAKLRAILIATCLLAGGNAYAEDSPLQGIQQMCSQRAQRSWTDFNPFQTHERARTNIYASCMVDHGLRP